MATPFVPIPTVPSVSGSRSLLAVGVGLAALIMGFTLFLLSMVLAEPSRHPIDVLAGAGNRASAAQNATGADTIRTPKSLSRLVPMVRWRSDPLGPVSTGPEVRSRPRAASNSREMALARGRSGESAHTATIP